MIEKPYLVDNLPMSVHELIEYARKHAGYDFDCFAFTSQAAAALRRRGFVVKDARKAGEK